MTIRAGQIQTPDGYVEAVALIDPATGLPATTDALTDAQLRASPVPVSVSGNGTDAPLYMAPVAIPADPADLGFHDLWTDGTRDGSSGGVNVLNGSFAVTPRIVYRTMATGAIVYRVHMFVNAGSALTGTGWGSGAGVLSKGIRFEIVDSDPTDPAEVPVWIIRPAPTAGETFVRSTNDLLQIGRDTMQGRYNASVTVEVTLPPGGLYIPPGYSFRIVVQDDTGSATASVRSSIAYTEL